MPQVAASDHFVIHAVAEHPADDLPAILTTAERVYAIETGWGYLPPLDDGDGKVDIYVEPFTNPGERALGGVAGRAALPGGSKTSTPGYIRLNSSKGRIGSKTSLIAHEFFHLLFFRIGSIGSSGYPSEAVADWAGHKVVGKMPKKRLLVDFETPLDCTQACKKTYAYKRSAFFTFLDRRYGTPVVKEILDRAVSRPTDITEAISQVVTEHGNSLEKAYADFSDFLLITAFNSGVRNHGKQTVSAVIYTGRQNGAREEKSFTLDHLSSRYVVFKGGSKGVSSGLCRTGKLEVTVEGPSVASVAPAIVSTTLERRKRPTAKGSTAMMTIPWSTCHSSKAMISLPNVSRSADGQPISVRTRLTVDR